jgi:hypothetical protein
LKNEIGPVSVVGMDAANFSCGDKNVVWLFNLKKVVYNQDAEGTLGHANAGKTQIFGF